MVTIDVKYTLVVIALIALIIVLIMLALLLKNLLTTIKNVNKITEDASTVSGIVAERAGEANDSFGDFSVALKGVADAMQGNKNLIGSVTNLAKATASLVKLVKSDKDKEQTN